MQKGNDSGISDSQVLDEVPDPVLEAVSLQKKKPDIQPKEMRAKKHKNKTFYISKLCESELSPNDVKENTSGSSRKGGMIKKIYKSTTQEKKGMLEDFKKLFDPPITKNSRTEIKNKETVVESESETIDDKVADPDYPCKLKMKNNNTRKVVRDEPACLMKVGFYPKKTKDSEDLQNENGKTINNFKIEKALNLALKKIEKDFHCNTKIEFPENQSKNKKGASTNESKINCKKNKTRSKKEKLEVKNQENKKYSAKKLGKNNTSKEYGEAAGTSNTIESKKSGEAEKTEPSGNKDSSVLNTQNNLHNEGNNLLKPLSESEFGNISNFLKGKNNSDHEKAKFYRSMLNKIIHKIVEKNGEGYMRELLKIPAIPSSVNQNSPTSGIYSSKICNKKNIITTKTDRNELEILERKISSCKRALPMSLHFEKNVKIPRFDKVNELQSQTSNNNFKNPTGNQEISTQSNLQIEIIDLTNDPFDGQNGSSTNLSESRMISTYTDPSLLQLKQQYDNLGSNIFTKDNQSANRPHSRDSSGYGSPLGVNDYNLESPQSGDKFPVSRTSNGRNDNPGMSELSRSQLIKHGANRTNKLFPPVSNKLTTNMYLNSPSFSSQNFSDSSNDVNKSSKSIPLILNKHQANQTHMNFTNTRHQSTQPQTTIFNSNLQPTTIWCATGLSNPKEIPVLLLPYPVITHQ